MNAFPSATAALMPALVAAAFGVAAFASGVQGDDWHGSAAQAEARFDGVPVNEPTFADVAGTSAARGCVSNAAWSEAHASLAEDDLARIPAESVVVTLDGTAHRVGTAEAWAKAGEQRDRKSGFTYWVVGSCA